jgi:hypothetical protein
MADANGAGYGRGVSAGYTSPVLQPERSLADHRDPMNHSSEGCTETGNRFMLRVNNCG